MNLPDSYAASPALPLSRHEITGEHAVSWGAVIAGAAGAAVLSMVLLLLGTGLGLTAVSPWSHEGISAGTATLSTIGWITLVQILASVLGGYLAGRLRTRWTEINLQEVYFRDTAHGFLAWAVATLLTATLLSTAVTSMVSGGAKVGAAVAMAAGTATGVAVSSTASEPLGYYVDSLFRPGQSAGAPAPSATAVPPTAGQLAEVGRIFAIGLKSGQLAAVDSQYLGQLVTGATGLPSADAESRVNDAFSKLKQGLEQAELKTREAADAARKASAYLALWLVITLFVGAFITSWSATFGGRLRDSSVLPHQ